MDGRTNQLNDERSGRLPRIEPRHVTVACLLTVAALALLWTFDFAQTLLLPLVLAVLLKFVLSPTHRRLVGWGFPSTLAAGAILGALVLGFSWGVSSLLEPAEAWVRDLPDLASRVRTKLGQVQAPVAAAGESIAEAGEEVKKAMGGDSAPVVELQDSKPLMATLVAGMRDLVGNSLLGLAFLFFLLATDKSFTAKAVALVRTRTERRAIEEVLAEVEREVTSYLATISVINALLGVAVAFAMWALGMPNPVLWGVMAMLLNFVPYLGALVGALIVGTVAFGSTDAMSLALLAPGAYLALSVLEGMLVTPSVLGRNLTMSPVAIFLWLMLWSWLWGPVGAVVAVPMLMIVKIICDHVPELHAVGVLIGRNGETQSKSGPVPAEEVASGA